MSVTFDTTSFRLYTTNRCDAVLNLLFRPTPDAYCHFYFPNAIKFVFHNHHLFKWLLVLIPDFGLLNRYFLGTDQNGI
jgi:hypothetical protein